MLNYVKPLSNPFLQQKASSTKTRSTLETRLAEAEAPLDVALTEATAHRDHLHDIVDHLSCNRSTLSIELNKTHFRLSAVRMKIGTVSG